MTVDAELRDAVALVFVDDLALPVLDESDAHHLVEVLRVGPNEPVAVSDGRGSYRMCTVESSQREPDSGRSARRSRLRARDVVLAFSGTPRSVEPTASPITVGFGIPKGDRAEWIIQKLTELGVDVIVPLITDRTVVRLDRGDGARRAERFRRVAREASSQSRRVRVPVVLEPCAIDDLPDELAERITLGEPGGEPITRETSAIFVGPEGGWSDAELERGYPRVQLSDQILRAETAAIVAGTLLSATRSGAVDFIRPTPE